MGRILLVGALLLAGGSMSGCDDDGAPSAYRPSNPHRSEPASEPAAKAPGKELVAFAPATDFTGASGEDAAAKAGALFDGGRLKDAVASPGAGFVGAGAPGAKGGKRVKFTAVSSPRATDLGGKEPPPPDGYDYSKSGASPGSAKGAGETLLGFARFQLEQKFATVAPIMSRLGWNAAPPSRAPARQPTPYRVTVHHTAGGAPPLTEAEAAKSVKGTQRYHMVGRGLEGKYVFPDIGYHFLIAGDGRVVEGVRAEYWGTHAGGANDGNIGIAMIGNFDRIVPTAAAVESLTRLVTYLALKYDRKPSTQGFLEPHKRYNNTGCPGKNMLAILDALRGKVDREYGIVAAGGRLGADFTPLAVVASPSA